MPISGVDYRRFNSKTKHDAFPLQRIDESVDALGGAQVFLTIDLASSYHQVAVMKRTDLKQPSLHRLASMNTGGCASGYAMHPQPFSGSCNLDAT